MMRMKNTHLTKTPRVISVHPWRLFLRDMSNSLSSISRQSSPTSYVVVVVVHVKGCFFVQVCYY